MFKASEILLRDKEDIAKYEKFTVKSSAYDIQHCIHCGKKFDDVDEVILHIKTKHIVIGSG